MRITIAEAKTHLRILGTEEDAAVAGLVAAAEEHVVKYLGEDFAVYLDEEHEDEFPGPVKSAILLLVGDLYVNRERTADVMLHENSTYSLLLHPYRDMELG